ncbi:EamA family transporter [Streptosporangium sp. NPDC049078]|uniref:DMT family transporter n=1 Tax=Streptosporangium sp. NPDC049078 TaxID=3155767 RepID=UPI00343D68D5
MTHVSVRRGLLYVSIAATAWGTGGAAGALLHQTGGLGPVAVSFWRFAAGAAVLLLARSLFGLGRAGTAETSTTIRRNRPTRWNRTPGKTQRTEPLATTPRTRPTEPLITDRRGRPTRCNPAAEETRQPRPLTTTTWNQAAQETRRTGPFSVLRRARHARRGSMLRRILVTGVAMAVYQTAYFAAIAESGLAVATVVTIGATPVLVAAGGFLLLGERLSATGLGAAVIALTGLAMLTLDGGSATFSAAGIGWALLSAAGYAGVTLLNRASTDEPYVTAMGGFVVGGLCLLPVALAQGLLPSGDPLASWAVVVYLGTVPTALAYGLFFTGLVAVRATTAAVISLVEPVGAAILGILLLGERLTPAAVCGSALLLGAVALLALKERGDRVGVAA